LNLKQFDDALTVLDEARKLDPFSPELFCQEGKIFQLRYPNEFERATSYYEKALAIAPHHRQR